MSRKPDVLLYQLLDSCRTYDLAAPKETGHILVGEELVQRLACDLMPEGERGNIPFAVVRGAFGGQPVKQVHAIVHTTVLKIPGLLERDQYLRNRARKIAERRGSAA